MDGVITAGTLGIGHVAGARSLGGGATGRLMSESGMVFAEASPGLAWLTRGIYGAWATFALIGEFASSEC